jgi:TonB family protein
LRNTKTMKFPSAIASAAVLLWAVAATAQAPIETFTGPKAIEKVAPSYPESERQTGDEGWVIVNLMIDPKGKPYEATVADSTGNRVFEKAALAAVDKWRFEPASKGGTPIDAGANVKLEFRLTGDSAASEQFVKIYKQVLKAVEAGDREHADSRLALLTTSTHNLYEDAYRAIATYTYYRKWGTDAQQLSALRRAIAGERSARYLPKGVFASALQAQLALEIRTQDYARALRTWETLNDVGLDAATRANLQKSIDQIQALRTDDKAYAVPGEIANTSWYYELLKQRFQIEVAAGAIAEVKLRCDQQYILFRFDPQLQYTISGNDSGCSMELIGDPGTKFRLIQL